MIYKVIANAAVKPCTIPANEKVKMANVQTTVLTDTELCLKYSSKPVAVTSLTSFSGIEVVISRTPTAIIGEPQEVELWWHAISCKMKCFVDAIVGCQASVSDYWMLFCMFN